MRISLPVYPTYKTRGEVVTLRWVRDNTSIPVPRVLAFDDTNKNDIVFEWIIMELMQGKTAHRAWRTMSMQQKMTVAEALADYQAQLARRAARHKFDTIGTLSDRESAGRPHEMNSKDELKAKVDHLVIHEFFIGGRLKLDVPRGPFCSSREWMTTMLDMVIQEQTDVVNGTTNDDHEDEENDSDKEEAQETIEVARRLLHVLGKMFPEQDSSREGDTNTSSIAEQTYIYHDDLNLKKILLDEGGHISAIVDWECVSALPLWMSARMPQFLRDDERWEEPNPDQYAADNDGSRIPGQPSGEDGEDGLDNQGKSDLYWIHKGEYEATVPGKAYRDKLGELWPAWQALREDGILKTYMYEAVLSCSNGVFFGCISRWTDAIQAGTVVRDGEILHWSKA